MDPNTNQPMPGGPAPQPQQPQQSTGPADQPAPQGTSQVPDWQQGLVTGPAAAQQPPAPQDPTQTTASAPGAAPAAFVSPDPAAGMPPQPDMGMPPTPNVPTGPQVVGGGPVAMGGAPAPKKRLPMVLLAIVVVVVLAMIAGGIYFALSGGKKTANNQAAASEKAVQHSTTELSSLSSVTLNPPSDLTSYGSNGATNANQYIYLLKNTPTNVVCELSLGIYSATELPGTDLNDIVHKGLSALSGVTITGPTAGNALVLNDASSSVKYSIPTLDYQVTQGVKHATFVLSIAILKDGNRAAITRDCANTSGPVDQSLIDTLNTSASQITVTKS